MKVLPKIFDQNEFQLNQTNPNLKPPSILKGIASGDKSAVKDCVETYGSRIWSTAKKFTDSTTEAEVVVLEIFNDVWRHASNYDAAKSSEAEFVELIIYRRLISRKNVTETAEAKG